MFHFIEEEEDEEIHGPGNGVPQIKRPDWLLDKEHDYPKVTISESDPDSPIMDAFTMTDPDTDYALEPHPDDTGDGPPQGPGDDTPVSRIEFEYTDGRIQRLTGKAAADWLDDINGPVVAQAIRYGTQQIRSDHPWQWSRRNDETAPVGWQRVTRRIYSPFWRAMHNLVAHPWLAVCRPIGEFLHEFTAERMYTPQGDKPPTVSDAD